MDIFVFCCISRSKYLRVLTKARDSRLLKDYSVDMNVWIKMLLVGFAVPVFASAPGFERYQVILDRKPFGDPPPEPEAPRAPVVTSPQQSFARTIRLSAIYEIQDGEIRVGLIDASNNNESFFLSVGESHRDIELVSASFEEEEAVLRRGSEMAIIKLADGQIEAITQQQHQERVAARQSSYEERRRARREAMERRRAEPPPEPRLTGEELEVHLRDYQMEVIRQGLPPLPIPLTPEMDAQLVEEGILEP